ncbi:MAG: tetratricopeptide repeat protein [bacterium]|nr:tetratricopeptide repeat protein [bacterium]
MKKKEYISKSILIGRDRELTFLKNAVLKSEFEKSHLITISGMEGMGKSYLVQSFLSELKPSYSKLFTAGIRNFEKEKYYGLRNLLRSFWNINDISTSDSSEIIEEYFRKNLIISFTKPYIKWFLGIPLTEREQVFLDNLKQKDKQDLTEGGILNLINYIANETSLVICIDGYHWLDFQTKNFIELLAKVKRNKNILIIITSRDDLENDFQKLEKHQLNLGPLTSSEIKTWLTRHFKCSTVKKEVLSFLVKRSEGNPLFLLHLSEYLHEKGALEIENNSIILKGKTESIPDDISKVILRRIRLLPKSQQQILTISAIIGNEFNLDFLQQLNPCCDTFEIETLIKKGFLDSKIMRTEKIHISLQHPIIKNIIYKNIPAKLKKENHNRVAELLEKELHEKHSELYDITAMHYMEAGRIKEFLRLSLISGKRKLIEFNLTGAENIYSAILKFSKKNPDAHYGLCETFYKQGKYDSALKLVNKIIYHTDKEMVFSGKLLKVNIFIKTGKYRFAEKLLTEIEKEVAGEKDYREKLLKILDTKGDLERILGKYTAAEEYFLDSLKLKIILFGENDLETGEGYQNLGVIYRNLGKFKESEEFLNKSLKIKRVNLGEKHPEIASIYHNLGTLYWNQGDFNKAKEFLEKSLDLKRVIYGETHQSIAAGYLNTGVIFWNMREFESALTYYFRALEIWKKFFGELHPNIAACYYNIGLTYLSSGLYSDAEENINKALKISSRILKKDHPEIIKLHQAIGVVNLNMHKFKAAEKNLKKALDIYKKDPEKNFWKIFDNTLSLCSLYIESGNIKKAEIMYRDSEKYLKEKDPEQYPAFFFRFYYLTFLLKKNAGVDIEELKSIASKIFNLIEKIKGHPFLYDFYKNAAAVALFVNEPEIAKKFLNKGTSNVLLQKHK